MCYPPEKNNQFKMFFNEVKNLDPEFKTGSAFDKNLLNNKGGRLLTLSDLDTIIASLLKKGLIVNPKPVSEYGLYILSSHKQRDAIFNYLKTNSIDRIKNMFEAQKIEVAEEDHNPYYFIVNIKSFLNSIEMTIKEEYLFENYLLYRKNLQTNDGDNKKLLQDLHNEEEKIINTIIKKFDHKTFVLLIGQTTTAEFQQKLQNIKDRLNSCEQEKLTIQNKIQELKGNKNEKNALKNQIKNNYGEIEGSRKIAILNQLHNQSLEEALKQSKENKSRLKALEEELDIVKEIIALKKEFEMYDLHNKSLNRIIKENIYNYFKNSDKLNIIIKNFIRNRLTRDTAQHGNIFVNQENFDTVFLHKLFVLEQLTKRENISCGSKNFLFALKDFCMSLAKKVHSLPMEKPPLGVTITKRLANSFKEANVSEKEIADYLESYISQLAIEEFFFPYRMKSKNIEPTSMMEKISVSWGFQEEQMPPVLGEYYDDVVQISVLHNIQSKIFFINDPYAQETLIKYIQYVLYHVIKLIEKETKPFLIVIKTPSIYYNYNIYGNLPYNTYKYFERLQKVVFEEISEALYVYNKELKNFNIIMLYDKDNSYWVSKEQREEFLKNLNYTFYKKNNLQKK